jgi:hypothetical protein
MKPNERSNHIANLFMAIVSAIGLLVFVFAGCALAFRPINFEWILLSAVTVLVVSRVDIGINRTRGGFSLSDTFIFISLLLFGTHASVVLAGLDAAASAIQFKERRRKILFNAAAMSLSIFAAGSTVTLTLGDLRPLTSDPGRLVLASAILAVIHLILSSGAMSVATAQETARSLTTNGKTVEA